MRRLTAGFVVAAALVVASVAALTLARPDHHRTQTGCVDTAVAIDAVGFFYADQLSHPLPGLTVELMGSTCAGGLTGRTDATVVTGPDGFSARTSVPFAYFADSPNLGRVKARAVSSASPGANEVLATFNLQLAPTPSWSATQLGVVIEFSPDFWENRRLGSLTVRIRPTTVALGTTTSTTAPPTAAPTPAPTSPTTPKPTRAPLAPTPTEAPVVDTPEPVAAPVTDPDRLPDAVTPDPVAAPTAAADGATVVTAPGAPTGTTGSDTTLVVVVTVALTAAALLFGLLVVPCRRRRP